MKPLQSKSTVKLTPTALKSASRLAPQRQSKAIALGAMCLALFMTNLDGTVVDVALPQIQASLGANLLGLQWVLNAYTLPVASLLLLSGSLGDIYGRKRVFSVGLVVFTLASCLCGLAPNLAILLGGRSLQGVGAAALIPLSLTILTDTFPAPQEKTKAIGVWTAVSALALLAGPALGGLLIDTLGWRSLFFLNLPLGGIAIVMTARSVKGGRYSRQALDWLGVAFSVALLASLTYALTEGSAGAWRSPHVLGMLGIAGLSTVGFWVAESRSEYPLLPLHLMRWSFVAINLVPVLVFFTSGSLLFIFSLFFQQVQGLSAAATGVRFLPLNAAIIIASLISGWLAARVGWRFVAMGGLVLASVATFSLAWLGASTESGEILGSLFLCGFGGGLTIAPLAAAAMNYLPPAQEGIASAVFNISIHLGGVLGIALQITIFAQRLAADLGRSLAAWNLSSIEQTQLIVEALHGEVDASQLPAHISPLAFQSAFNQAFVSGLHATAIVASIALIVGAVLLLLINPPRSRKHHSLTPNP